MSDTTKVVDGKKVQTVTVTPFDNAFVDAWATLETARQTRQNTFKTLLEGEYGETAPTFAQYEERIKALSAVCKERRISQQYVIKDFRIAVKELYKDLPVSMDKEAVKKRNARAAKTAEKRERALAIGLVKPKEGEVIPPVSKFGVAGTKGNDKKDVTPEESDEQLVTRVGMFRVLGALERILSAQDETKQSARELAKLNNKLRALLKPAEEKPAAPATGTDGK